MKNILALFLTLSLFKAYSQNSIVSFYNDEGLPFRVMMNGQWQNERPEANVKINNLMPISYKVRIVFLDTANGVVNDKINVRPGMEHFYLIKRKKVTAIEKKTKSIGNTVSRDLNMKSEEEAAARYEEIENMNAKFVLKIQNLLPLQGAPQPAQQPVQQPMQPTQRTTVVTSTPAPVGVQQSTTTTTTTVATPGVGANINGGGANVSMNINMGGFATGATVTEQTTTTTTVGGGQQVVAQNHYVMPGYNGPVGCPWPMDAGAFSQARNSINSKSFEDSKMTMAKQIIGSNCLTSAQVKEIMLMFSFEETRLDFAKFAYGRTFDIGNYFIVNDGFTFETSIDELNAYINGYRW